MYQEAIKYTLKVWGTSTAIMLAMILFINRNQGPIIFWHIFKEYVLGFGITSLIASVIIVLWFRFKFDGEVFIKRLLTGVVATFLAILFYVHLSVSISQSSMLVFLVAMIGGIWYFKLPMFKPKVDQTREQEDILDA